MLRGAMTELEAMCVLVATACTVLIFLCVKVARKAHSLEQIWPWLGLFVPSSSLCYKAAVPRAPFQKQSSGAQSVSKSLGKSCLAEVCFPWEHKFMSVSMPHVR